MEEEKKLQEPVTGEGQKENNENTVLNEKAAPDNNEMDSTQHKETNVTGPESYPSRTSEDTLPPTAGAEEKEDEVEALRNDGGVVVTGPSPPTRPRLEDRTTTIQSKTKSLPPLKRKETRMMQKHAHPWEHLGITLGLPAILLFDIVVPCIIYYTWYYHHKHKWERQCREQYTDLGQVCPLEKPEFDKDIMGYAIISFGAGELWILIARVWRLWFRHDDCAPLLSRAKWELDATSWVYGVAMILALIPFVVGSSLTNPHLYLYSPSFLMGFLGILMVITTCHPFKIPIGINSHARGSGLRPFIYYAAEDFIAVDGLQDREFRIRYNERYESNKAFRRMFLYLTIWWILGVCVYIGCVSAVIWTCEFHIAFGLSLGVLFAYIAVWAAVSYVWVRIEIAREHKAFEAEQEAE